MRTKSVVAFLVGMLLLVAASSSYAEMRKWTVKGTETEAEFVKREGKVVTLRTPDGKETAVKMGELGEEDRKYVKQLAKGEGKAESKKDDQSAGKGKKPTAATSRMTGEYPSLAGKWVESEEGKRYVTITQDGNKFVGKSNTFNLDNKANHHYAFEGTISKGGRVSGSITSDGGQPGTLTGRMDADGKTVRFHSKEGGNESDWTLTMKGSGAEEPKHAGKKEHGKKPQADDTADSQRKHESKELSFDLGGGVKLELVLIPAGEFLMGSPGSDKDVLPNEKPQHRVRITKPFYLGKYLVTQEQWEEVMGNNPSHFKGPKNPAEQVSWDDCQNFSGSSTKNTAFPT